MSLVRYLVNINIKFNHLTTSATLHLEFTPTIEYHKIFQHYPLSV